jgi:sec-independent protein translocase protein TatC
VLSAVSFYFSEPLMQFLIKPLGDVKLHVTEVTGSFYAYLKVALIFGIGGSLPVIVYQLWMFVSPGLYKSERAMILPFILISLILFGIGAGFCYLVVLPLALDFLIGFGGEILNPIITVSSYLGFAGMLLLSFGFGFELPIVAFVLGKVGIISSGMLARGRRYAVVGILIVAAVLTPTPDVFTQLMLAGPLYLLYELSIIVVRITGRRN